MQPQSDMPFIDDIIEFINMFAQRTMSETIKINLIALVSFLVIFIISEVLRRQFSKDEPQTDSPTLVILQLGATAVIIILLFMFIRYERTQIMTHAHAYQDVVERYEDYEPDFQPTMILEELMKE